MGLDSRHGRRQFLPAQQATIGTADEADGRLQPGLAGGNQRGLRFGGRRHRLHQKKIDPGRGQEPGVVPMFGEGDVKRRGKPGRVAVLQRRYRTGD